MTEETDRRGPSSDRSHSLRLTLLVVLSVLLLASVATVAYLGRHPAGSALGIDGARTRCSPSGRA